MMSTPRLEVNDMGGHSHSFAAVVCADFDSTPIAVKPGQQAGQRIKSQPAIRVSSTSDREVASEPGAQHRTGLTS